MARVPVFVIALIVVNTLIGFKEVIQVIQVFSCIGKCWLKWSANNCCFYSQPKVHKVHWVNPLRCFCVTTLGCLLHFHVCE